MYVSLGDVSDAIYVLDARCTVSLGDVSDAIYVLDARCTVSLGDVSDAIYVLDARCTVSLGGVSDVLRCLTRVLTAGRLCVCHVVPHSNHRFSTGLSPGLFPGLSTQTLVFSSGTQSLHFIGVKDRAAVNMHVQFWASL